MQSAGLAALYRAEQTSLELPGEIELVLFFSGGCQQAPLVVSSRRYLGCIREAVARQRHTHLQQGPGHCGVAPAMTQWAVHTHLVAVRRPSRSHQVLGIFHH